MRPAASWTLGAAAVAAAFGAGYFVSGGSAGPSSPPPRAAPPPSPASPRAPRPGTDPLTSERVSRLETDLASVLQEQERLRTELERIAGEIAAARQSGSIPPEVRAQLDAILSGGNIEGTTRVLREFGSSMIRSRVSSFALEQELDTFQRERMDRVIERLLERRNRMIDKVTRGEMTYDEAFAEGGSLLAGALAEASEFLTPQQYSALRAAVEELPPVRMGILRIGPEAPPAAAPPGR